MKKKKCFVCALCLGLSMLLMWSSGAWAAVSVEINEANFPDSVFRSYVSSNFDTNSDGSLDVYEINDVTSIITSASGMTSLQGIENFTALQYLNFWDGSIESIDLTWASNLVSLDCVNDGLTKIDFPANSNLQYIKCKDNQLTSLVLLQQNSLVSLDCMNNQLSELFVSSDSLVYLECGNNQLADIGVLENCPNLEELGAWTNNLQTINISQNTKLKELRLYNSGSYELDLSGLTQLVSADANSSGIFSVTLQSNDSLVFLNVSDNKLATLYAGSDFAPNLTNLVCANQSADSYWTCYTSGDLYYTGAINKSNVQVFDSNGNELSYTSDDFFIYTTVEPSTIKYDWDTYNSSTPTMQNVTASFVMGTDIISGVYISSSTFPNETFRNYISSSFDADSDEYLSESEISAITSIDVSGMGIDSLEGIEYLTNLQVLECYSNSLTSLNVSSNDKLVYLDCSYNQLTTLDVSKNTSLEYLFCVQNYLTNLDVTNNSLLQILECKSNQLSALNVKSNAKLIALDCSDNQLTGLDVTSNADLTELDCGYNSLEKLDVTKNSLLETLWCHKNQLTGLDVASNSALTDLRCFDNQMTTLDVTSNINLQHLDCGGNKFTTFDAKQNTSLDFLCVANNQLTTIDISQNKKLESFWCEKNQLTTLDVSNNTDLTELRCHKNQLMALDLDKNTALSVLSCDTQNVSFDMLGTVNGRYAIRFSDLPFNASEFASRVSNLQVWDSSSNSLSVTSDNSYIYFSAKPSSMSYRYRTIGVTVAAIDIDNAYMDVTVTFTGVKWSINENTPDTGTDSSSSSSNAWRYQFTMPSSLSDKIASKFGINSSQIFQFSDSEILSSSGSLSTEDAAAIRNLNETVIIQTPTFLPNNTGVYVMRYSIDSSYAGKALKFHGITSEASSDNIPILAALESPSYTFYDADYNEITEVPSDGIVYAAVNMTAGRASGGVITTAQELMSGTIEPIPEEDRETLSEAIAKTLSETLSTDIKSDDINFITEENILGGAVEPTQTLKDDAKNKNDELVGKLSTLSVDKNGYYAFKVILSDDLYESVKNTKVEDLKVYYIQYDEGEYVPLASLASDGKVKLSFITGLLNTFELLTMSGEKMQFGMKEFLMVGFLNAGKPMSLYIAKLILALLLGGCNTGIIPAVSLAVLGVFIIKHRRKEK